MHNFVDTGWRKLGAFLLRALRVYIRGLVQWKSFEFHASHAGQKIDHVRLYMKVLYTIGHAILKF